MDKDILMLQAFKLIIQHFNQFSIGTSIRPEIKLKLSEEYRKIRGLTPNFVSLLLERTTNQINDEEIDFVKKLTDVVVYGTQKDQEIVVAAAERLATYLREKIALIHIAIEGANPSAPTS